MNLFEIKCFVKRENYEFLYEGVEYINRNVYIKLRIGIK